MTDHMTVQAAERILGDLVAIPTVNPVGRPWAGTQPVERAANDTIAGLFAPYGVGIERQAVSPMHENLAVTLPGRSTGGCLLFESHVDTVPADEWLDRAFQPRVEGDLLYGRGSCDDKASLTAMIMAALDLLERGLPAAAPVVLLAAGDEEYAQTGIKHVRAGDVPVVAGIFGEPTRLMPVVQHKGTARWDITVHGRSAHTSRPELGVNAILGAADLIRDLGAYQAELRSRYGSPLMTGPAITVSMIHGGRTRNAVPDECTISVDFRVTPGMHPVAARDALIDRVAGLGLVLSHSDLQIMTPPLDTPVDHPFSLHVLDICRSVAGPQTELCGEPYGTDASWLSDRAPALVLGPGDIAYAHAVDERVSLAEVVACARIYREIMLTWAG